MRRDTLRPSCCGHSALLVMMLVALPLSSCIESASEICSSGRVCGPEFMCALNQDICINNSCGDGIVQQAAGGVQLTRDVQLVDEVCDDGNNIDGDGCSANCASDEICGNGKTDPSEKCDDGNTLSGDGCSADCKTLEDCGDGILDTAKGEKCDDGNKVPGDGCSADCVAEFCGNGTKDPSEKCDDGNKVSGDGCSADCQSDETCSNGHLDIAQHETCDDGNKVSGDGCSAECVAEFCGNRTKDPSEKCDDGNKVSGDGCSPDCLSDETCGNGYLDVVKDENCDDGNRVSGDGCRADCRSNETCGNGHTDVAKQEVCDDGDNEGGDGCSADCRSNETCGNGIKDPEELCDDGNDTNSDGCSAKCKSFCGDGKKGSYEVCDDGNANSCGSCNSLCTQIQAAVKAIGTIKVNGGSVLVEGEKFILNDGIHPPWTFEFGNTPEEPVDDRTFIPIESGSWDQAKGIKDAINGVDSLAITAKIISDWDPRPTVMLEHEYATALGNRPIIESIVNSTFEFNGMSGGKASDCAQDTGCARDVDCAPGLLCFAGRCQTPSEPVAP